MCFHYHDLLSQKWTKQASFSVALRAVKAFILSHYLYSCESHHNIRKLNYCTMKVELRTQGTGQRLHCECSCRNRLNKLVIHTPTAVCGCQKEEKNLSLWRGENISLSPNVPPAWFVFWNFTFFFTEIY